MDTQGKSSATPREMLLQAVSLYQNGHVEAAIKLYQQVLRQAPNDYQALHFLGVAQGHLGDWITGVQSIERAVALKSDYADAYNSLGYGLAQLGRYEAAMPCFERAVALKKDYVEARSNWADALSLWGARLIKYNRLFCVNLG